MTGDVGAAAPVDPELDEVDGVDEADEVPLRRPVPWGPMCGAVTLIYVVAVAADRMLLAADGVTYNDVHRHLDGPLPRVLLAVVLVACLFHTLDGVRRLLAPAAASDGTAARAAVAFATGAIGIPVAVVVLWPWLGPVAT